VTYTEQAVVFACGEESLVGVMTIPQTSRDTAVLVIVGGPQYRVGSHRQFVLLARKLASHGFPVFRFDCRGMGDSSGAPRSFESLSNDIGAAVDKLLVAAPRVRRVVLWGLCDGASAALLYCHEMRDARVGGLCLLNPWVRSVTSRALTQVKHYYSQRMMGREFWAKLLRGQIGVDAVAGLVSNVRTAFARPNRSPSAQATFQKRMALAWNQFQPSILLLLSSDDHTAKEFLEHIGTEAAWAHALERPRLQQHTVVGADHTFSRIADRVNMEELTVDWLQIIAGAKDRVTRSAVLRTSQPPREGS
jgi:exosortase A-associated hydrolase 1